MFPKFEELSANAQMGGELLCPSTGCDSQYLTHYSIEVFERGEDATTGLHVTVAEGSASLDNDLAGNPSKRRHGLSILFSCEQCQKSHRLTIAQHKGSTWVNMEVA